MHVFVFVVLLTDITTYGHCLVCLRHLHAAHWSSAFAAS